MSEIIRKLEINPIDTDEAYLRGECVICRQKKDLAFREDVSNVHTYPLRGIYEYYCQDCGVVMILNSFNLLVDRVQRLVETNNLWDGS